MKQQNEKGITLVALVITIIVLVILVGVSVSTALNTGLIGNSKNAVAQYDKAQTEEEIEIDKVAKTLDAASAAPISAGGYAGDSNKKFVSGGKTAYIPAGFTVSNITGEKTIDEGLVIYSGNVTDWTTDTDGDGIVNAQENYNQYVWIPVENPSDIYGTITEADVTKNPNQGLVVGEKYGKLYCFEEWDFGMGFDNPTLEYATSPTDSKITHKNWPNEAGYSNDRNHEPAYFDDNSYNKDANGNKIITEAGIKNEFSRMIASVEAYGGFYIGRYELTGTKDTPALKKGLLPLTNINWYKLYTSCQKLEQNNNKVKAHTTMIWGCQWDQAIKKSLIATTDAQTGVSDFLTNAGNYGIYDASKTTSGKKTAAYNIYDMGGNVFDWTLEAYYTDNRVVRGGKYRYSASDFPASYCSYYNPSGSYDYDGCRSQLYL